MGRKWLRHPPLPVYVLKYLLSTLNFQKGVQILAALYINLSSLLILKRTAWIESFLPFSWGTYLMKKKPEGTAKPVIQTIRESQSSYLSKKCTLGPTLRHAGAITAKLCHTPLATLQQSHAKPTPTQWEFLKDKTQHNRHILSSHHHPPPSNQPSLSQIFSIQTIKDDLCIAPFLLLTLCTSSCHCERQNHSLIERCLARQEQGCRSALL
jgi:hypothetical protein